VQKRNALKPFRYKSAKMFFSIDNLLCPRSWLYIYKSDEEHIIPTYLNFVDKPSTMRSRRVMQVLHFVFRRLSIKTVKYSRWTWRQWRSYNKIYNFMFNEIRWASKKKKTAHLFIRTTRDLCSVDVKRRI